MSTAAVMAVGLTRTYSGGIAGLQPVDLSIEPGMMVAVQGRSGSGKTTLLNLIGGLDRPTGGTIEVFGTDLTALSDADRTEFRRSTLGFLFQNDGLIGALSAMENVEIGLRITGRSGGRGRLRTKARRKLSEAALERVGLVRWQHHRPDELSGGQRARVALARALVVEPRLLVADEPTGELDREIGHDMIDLIRSLVDDSGLTAVIGTHDPAVTEAADHTIDIGESRPVTSDSTMEEGEGGRGSNG